MKKKCEKIIVLGLGISGNAAVELAKSKKIQYEAFDEKKSTANIKDNIMRASADASLIVVSPGIPENSILMKAAKLSKLPIISEIEFAGRFTKKPILALTGTNGKTTTTELTAHILNQIGIRASAAGNTGFAFSKAVINDASYDCHVVEISSFQLERSSDFCPAAAALLNISSDHLNRYKKFKDYELAKFSIFKNVKEKKSIIKINLLKKFLKLTSAKTNPLTFSLKKTNNAEISADKNFIYLRDGNKLKTFMAIPSDNLPGKHNIENLMAAVLLIKSFLKKRFNNNLEKIKKAVANFKLGKHRMEVFLENRGIKYVNDSKATNPDATIAAIDVFGRKKNIVIILGGLDKKMDFSPIIKKKNAIKKACIIGQCRKKINNILKNNICCALFNGLEDAVDSACATATPGDTVLLSPSCASMDMFENYQERGIKFIEIIKRRLSK
jgi:UDP-N-acetylmuramoylalanine--D-glutamate ligase